MQIKTPHWTVSAATHIGQSHRELGKNCQDAFCVGTESIDGRLWVCGVVSDGCGGVDDDLQKLGLSGRSEVGAALLSEITVGEIFRAVWESSDYSPEEKFVSVFDVAFSGIIEYIRSSANRVRHLGRDHEIKHIMQFWLSTLVGFLINENTAYVFYCGDGIFQINNALTILDDKNSPHYIAYAACRRPDRYGLTPAMIPTSFQVVETEQPLNRLLLASDGYVNHDVQRITTRSPNFPNDPPLTNPVHAAFDKQVWGRVGNFGLKKWMNTRFDRGYFEDDCTIITVERA